MNTKLPQLFTVDSGSNNATSNLTLVKHKTEPYIVLSHLQNMSLEERENHASQLQVSAKLMYDSRGYLMGIYSENSGQWQPRYQLCETAEYIKVIIELAGFNKDNSIVEVDKQTITITGIREKFIESVNEIANNYSQIPIGPFELKISTDCDINIEETKLDCADGLFTITCPKVQNIKKRLT